MARQETNIGNSSQARGEENATMSPLRMSLASTETNADVSRMAICCGEDEIDGDRAIKLIGEIVAGYRLSHDDDNTEGEVDQDLKPYCIVKFGNNIVHKTQKAEGGCNPVWTVSTGSFFLLEVTPKKLVYEELQVSVWSKRRDPLKLNVLEMNCFVGKAEIDLSKVLLSHGTEERLEVDLRDGVFEPALKRGTLTLRFRLATPSDVRFLSLLHSRPELLKQRSTRTQASFEDTEIAESLLVTEANETQKVGETFMHAISSAFTSKKYFDKKSGQNKVLVKPNPDPTNVHETTYLSAQDIANLTMGPSTQWVRAGSGTIGKVYLEILACKDLPNVDVGEAVGNVTDAFVSAVFEDAMVQTSVIDDELSPHWLPWTQRAFVFKMMHPASTLYLAAFDYDLGITAHQALGRVAVNISNLQRDTDYTLTYNLYPSANVTDRTAAGSVTIRVRVEFNDEKEALLAAIRPRPTFHINVRKEKSLSVLRYTCFGEYGDDNEHPFDLTVTRSYVNEILEYKRGISYSFGDAICSLIFWRGQVRVVNLYLPLHSFFFFCFATTLVERPYMAPSFFLLSVAWIMLATQRQRMQHPSPWNRCHSFWHYVNILRTGKSSHDIRCITANQGAKEAEAYEKQLRDRLANDERIAAKQAEMQQEIANLGDDSIHTKVPLGIPLDLFVRLTRYQGIVGRMCKKMRLVKSVVTWEEGAVSFWITFCFLAAGLVSLLLPWAFILLWGSRIVVWSLFGPHMMLLDWWLRVEGKDEAVLEKAVQNFKKESWFARIRRQEALKLRDMKRLAFGKYITLVPSHNLSRHFDRPLPASSARLHNPIMSQIKIAPRGVPGQQLFGVILPRTESESLANEKEFAALSKLQSEVVYCIKAIKESENCSLLKRLISQTSQDEDPQAEVGYELVSCTSDDAANDSTGEMAKRMQQAGTKVESLSPTSKVAILQKNRSMRRDSLISSAVRSRQERNTCKDTENEKYRVINAASSTQIGESSALLANAESKSAKDMRVKRVQSWSVGDAELSYPGTHAGRLPTLIEADECRECGEVEVILALPVREDPSTGESDPDGDEIGTNHHERSDESGKPREASIELNGNSVKFIVADDETVDLGSFFGDDDASASCIVHYQCYQNVLSNIRVEPSTKDFQDEDEVVNNEKVDGRKAEYGDDQQQNVEFYGGVHAEKDHTACNEIAAAREEITSQKEKKLDFVVPEIVSFSGAPFHSDVSWIADLQPPSSATPPTECHTDKEGLGADNADREQELTEANVNTEECID